jgi:hypothetical protein
MVSLAIKPMLQGRPQRLNNFFGHRDSPILDHAGELAFIARLNVGDIASIFGFAGLAQGRECVERNGAQSVGRPSLARKALHPNSVGDQEVVEGAVHGLKDGPAIPAESGRGIIEPLIGPSVVAVQPWSP